MTRVTKGMSLRATPDEEQLASRTRLRRWAGIAAVAAAAVLGVTGLAAGAENGDADQPTAADRASGGPATDDPTEDPADPPPGRRIACAWTSDITSEVGPADDIGRPPLPDAALVMELCDGVWTGSLAWLVHGAGAGEQRQSSDPPTASACSRPRSADAFLPGSRRVPVCWRR